MADLSGSKQAARKAAISRRRAAHATGVDACPLLADAVSQYAGEIVAGYWPIRTEADPRAALQVLSRNRRIVLPVVEGAGKPLSFRCWSPGAEMIEGAFGAAIPKETSGALPGILIVPLLAFDARGYRLGYGGGFYDRTLEWLRASRPTLAIGFAYAAQFAAELPVEPTDQPLDMIVTEAGIQRFSAGSQA